MYLPISRKYRPADFTEIVGQDHITRTLKNAILMDKAAAAYLFSGSRGVGKTSTARVFAKALNCRKGPTDKPCGKCVSCEEISRGASMDVIEIDGASNRGIDEIRNLRENVKLKPISGKYKIYIIDEVHMLTPEAFNALLKTLEEPPPHVKFFFATTRPYKILPTILSRCQRFDFHMLSNQVIADKLNEIAAKEKIKADPDALFLIARAAQGGMRDAQVMLDQAASYTGGKIKSADVISMLGLMGQDALIGISEAVIKGDSQRILEMIDGMINGGKDAMFIAVSLIEHYRNLMIMASCRDFRRHVILNSDDVKKMEELGKSLTLDDIFYAVYTLSGAVDTINKTSLGKVPLELALLKLARKEKLEPLSEVIKKLETMEAKFGGASNSPAAQYRQEPPAVYAKSAPAAPAYDEPPPVDEIDGADMPAAAPQAAPTATPSPDEPADLKRIRSVWPEVIRIVKSKKVSCGTYLEEGVLLDLKGGRIILGFSKSNTLHKEALETKQNITVIREAMKDLLEVDMGITFAFTELSNGNGSGGQQASGQAGQAAEAPRTPFAQVSRKIEPIIRTALDKFNGKIVKQYYVKEGN